MITGYNWAFRLPDAYELTAIGWRADLPPKIHMRTPAGALVIYTPKAGVARANENQIVPAHRQAVGFR